MSSEPGGRGRPIVVVEDDKDTREIISAVLEKAGYEVRSAPNGLRLLSMLQSENPFVILMDVMLSWIDGFELCKALKRNPEFKDVPVIFISGRTAEADIEKGFESGGTDYFTKPVDFERLLSRVAEISGREKR
jgi:DNA-binding response OmpR family regulator